VHGERADIDIQAGLVDVSNGVVELTQREGKLVFVMLLATVNRIIVINDTEKIKPAGWAGKVEYGARTNYISRLRRISRSEMNSW
jgi:hypothetical protein